MQQNALAEKLSLVKVDCQIPELSAVVAMRRQRIGELHPSPFEQRRGIL